MKVALVYDRINKWGGAERVLLAFHELFPNAPLYTALYHEKAGWADVFDIRTSFLQKLPWASLNHDKLAVFMPIVFESFNFDGYDLVISVTSEAAKGIKIRSKTRHVCYCLTPTRYLWSGYDDYFNRKVFRLLSKPAVFYLRKWDKIAAGRPNHFVAISKEVQRRIKKYYGRESKVIYPPLMLSAEVANKIFEGSERDETLSLHKDIVPNRPCKNFISSPYSSHNISYFLIVSRLVPYKKIDIAIKAFNKLKLPLKIIGTGSEMKKLKSIAGPTVEFLGNLTDRELLGYYKGCSALVFTANEDFGLVMLEAQSMGRPVIAFGRGGAIEAVIGGKTGDFFYPQTDSALVKVVRKFKASEYKKEDCVKWAEKFNKERFKKEFMRFLARI